jgi:4-hydroxyphenylacetate 3-monooxygenase
MLAELLLHVDAADSILYTAVHRATRTPFGTFVPEEKLLTGLQITFYERLNKMIETLRTVGAGGLVGVPSHAELKGDLGATVEHYFQSSNSNADERIRLMRLANDACVSGFAGRLQLYEQYYQGDPYRRRCSFYKEHPRRGTLTKRIDQIMEDHCRRAKSHGL